jgi:3-oxoacyl-[acyl-carrier protein] reductase
MSNHSVIAITGTSKGTGKGIAEYFLKRNFKVFGCSRGNSVIENENYYHTHLDLRDETQVQKWVRSIKKSAQKIDVLVSNAGLVESALQMIVTSGTIVENIFDSNFFGSYFVCREAAKVMVTQKYGRIITISSTMASLHEPGTSVYSASKSAVVEMTKVLAREVAPFGITCNSIAPAMIDNDASGAFGEEWTARMLDKQTIKRKVTIEEICNVIAFLIASESSCITGEVIHMGLVS